jgi:hypothetical protein
MWHHPDSDEPTSKLFRLMPSRPCSELREALDTATGRDHTAHGSLALKRDRLLADVASLGRRLGEMDQERQPTR